MNRTTLILLSAVVVLGGVTWAISGDDEAPAIAGLSVPGYASQADLDRESEQGILAGPLDIAHEIDGVRIVPPGGPELALSRRGSGADSQWRISKPEAFANKHIVDKITGLFKTDTDSGYATTVKPEELALYDLDPDRRIELELSAEGTVYRGVHLYVGRTESPEQVSAPGAAAEVDTWVAKVDDPTVVYRIVGKDLRAPASVGLKELRNTRVFDVEANDLEKIKVTAPTGEVIVLTGARSETPATEPNADPTVKVDWTLVEPAGVTADSTANALARSLAQLRAKAFVAVADAPQAAIDGRFWEIEGTARATDEGPARSIVLHVAAGEDPEDATVVWARVPGKEEFAQLAKYTANQLRKTVADLKDKAVLSLKGDAVTGLTVEGPDETVSLARREGTWHFTTPTVPYQADPSALLGALARVSAARWARTSEIPAARAALAAPAIRVQATVGETVYMVAFSAALTGGDHESKRWGVVGDPATAEPFLIADYSVQRFATNVSALRQKKLFPAAKPADVDRLEITVGGGPTAILTTAAGGLALSNPPEGTVAKAGQGQVLSSTFAALSAKAFVTQSSTKVGLDAPAATVVGTLHGQVSTLKISAQDQDGDPYATVDVGPLAGQVFTLNSYQAKNLQKTLTDLSE